MNTTSYHENERWSPGFITAAFLGVALLLATSGITMGQNNSVEITPEDTTLQVEQTATFEAVLVDDEGNETDTTFSWESSHDTVATVTENGLVTAVQEGETEITASIGDTSATAHLEVEGADKPEDPNVLTVVPEDTLVEIGSTVQYQAQFDADSSVTDTTVEWSVRGQQVGTIDDSGNFTASASGIGLIRAETSTDAAEATVIVQDSTTDTTGTQTITIIQPRPSDMAPVDSTTLEEGESYKFGGFPFPYNILNGGMLHFPHGSLSEDITITINMPDFANVETDSVSFEGEIVSGVTFNVSVDDSVHSPYYFRQPITVSLPYKRGLIHNVLGITPDQLGMFFYDSETGVDSTGISGTVVDSSSNRIFASVAHFSDVVLAPKSTSTSIEDEPRSEEKATSFKLGSNYPNPFNPTTSISYTIPSNAKVTLEVYNLLGKRVATLVDSRQQSGQHTVRFDASNLSSGVYMYRIKAGSFQAVRKMTLMK